MDLGLEHRHDYRIIRVGRGKTGNVLLRARDDIIEVFGLTGFPCVEFAYERNGGKHIGKLRTSPRKVNWQSYRIEVPERYPSGRRNRGWAIGLSAGHRQYDFIAIARVIEASGRPWLGFQKASGGLLFRKEFLLASAPLVQLP